MGLFAVIRSDGRVLARLYAFRYHILSFCEQKYEKLALN